MSGTTTTTDIESESDAALMSRIQDGDNDAVAELYRRHHHPALCYALSLTRDRSQAGDLAADAFLRLWDAIKAGREPRRPRSYLMTIVHNLWIDELRHVNRRASGADPTDPDGRAECPPVPDFADLVAERDSLRAATSAMCARQRTILWETVVEGYCTSELAERHGAATANAAAQLASRAKRNLKQAYLASVQPAAGEA
jgi:RNA polymerase sigma factor (sigma-70 family)